ncbi:Hypothetical protein, putative [Bodo saltans]|uniref:RRM domain-containing protein n=1 Tax=Bodo saltans TaxID=75058 RepID=A0A0S4JTJ1_BODSA|nr:Hypothetical protein, putative [Bodo saltans]|eukprot:CUG94137.1 Hypothetical protein, putative [Bodo saltans]
MFSEHRRNDPYNTRVTTNPVHRALLKHLRTNDVGFVRVRNMTPTTREDYECPQHDSDSELDSTQSFNVTETSQHLFVGQLPSELAPTELARLIRNVMGVDPLRVTRGNNRTCMFVQLRNSHEADRMLSFNKRLLMDTDLVWIDKSDSDILVEHMARDRPCQCAGRSALPKHCVTIEKRNIRQQVMSLPLRPSDGPMPNPRAQSAPQLQPAPSTVEAALYEPDRYFGEDQEVDDEDVLVFDDFGGLN